MTGLSLSLSLRAQAVFGVHPMDPTLACRLIRASNLAYGINSTGTGFEPGEPYATLLASTGFAPDKVRFVRPDGIDGCYWGETIDGAVILAFRGTLPPSVVSNNPKMFFDVLLDWLNDANAIPVKGQDLAGLVHAGFMRSLDAMWPAIDLAVLRAAIAAGRPLYVTGHSKGGSLAHLVAYRLARAGINPTAIYTFAAARAGDRDFATAYNQVCPSTWRFEYRDDLVPHLPPHTGGWLDALKVHRSTATKFPADAPHPTGDPSVIARAEALISRLETLELPDYASAGTLEFIDWADPPGLDTDSFTLSLKREFSLAEKFAEFKAAEIAGDHSGSGGYMLGACGTVAS
jgi:hypothetical protein